MKILLIEHMAWMTMLAHEWKLVGAEIIRVPLDIPALVKAPALRDTAARSIADALRAHEPHLVIDVNAAGILPLDPDARHWTNQESQAPWCVWWWDAPHIGVCPLRRAGEEAAFFHALRHPMTVHFCWDPVLAREYTGWFGSPVGALPTATHPGYFHPDAAAQSSRSFPPVDLCFLGTHYPPAPDPTLPDIETLAQARISQPLLALDELILQASNPSPRGRTLIQSARLHASGAFNDRWRAYRELIDQQVGFHRRSRPLQALRERIPSRYFAGHGWPEAFHADPQACYQPAHLAALYRQARFCLDLKNAQSHTGAAMRSYEIMACGGVLVCLEAPDFDPAGALKDHVYLLYPSIDALIEGLRERRDDIRGLTAIRENARHYALEHHAWHHRLHALLSHLSRATAPPPTPPAAPLSKSLKEAPS